MSRHRQANSSAKARQSRLYRRNQRDQKRFEAPLREFVEIKYKDIFEEYVQLYNQMVAENSEKINLKKTQTFKQWKRANQHSGTDILSIAIRETIQKEVSVVAESEQADQSEAEQGEADQSEADQSEAGERVNEALLAAQQVDDLVNHMIRDDELRAILDAGEPEDDEGIELNICDEIEMDIEPFDFRMEMEALGW